MYRLTHCSWYETIWVCCTGSDEPCNHVNSGWLYLSTSGSLLLWQPVKYPPQCQRPRLHLLIKHTVHNITESPLHTVTVNCYYFIIIIYSVKMMILVWNEWMNEKGLWRQGVKPVNQSYFQRLLGLKWPLRIASLFSFRWVGSTGRTGRTLNWTPDLIFLCRSVLYMIFKSI